MKLNPIEKPIVKEFDATKPPKTHPRSQSSTPKPTVLPALPSDLVARAIDTSILLDHHEEKVVPTIHPKKLLAQIDSAPVSKIPFISTEVRKINIKQLVDTIKPLIENHLTPLLLDQSERCDIFFQYSGDYSGLFVEAKKLVVETLVFKKVTMQEALEELRKQLVNCLKYGRTMVIRMTDTACDFLNKFNHPDYFPVADLFVEAGQRFKKHEYWSKVVRDEDFENGTFVVRDEFCVILCSTLAVDVYAETLKNAIPISECIPILIEPPPPARPNATTLGGLGGYGI